MKTKAILAAILVGLLLLAGPPAYAQQSFLPSGIADADIGNEIAAYVEANRETTAGMAVAVFRHDQVLFEDSFGYENIAEKVPVTENSVFEWGSVSKLLVWTSVMQLKEQGQLDLHADIKGYLPDGFLTTLAFDAPITMIDLMNHKPGYQETLINIFSTDPADLLSLESVLAVSQPDQIFEPGKYTAYSNWGTSLAALIVERVSGMSYDAYVHTHIFSPLGMEHTAIKADLSDNAEVAKRHAEMQCYRPNGALMADSKFYIPMYPSGAATGTIGDMLTFAQALSGGKGMRQLFQKDATWEEMRTATDSYPQSGLVKNAHGMWVEFLGVPFYGHGGNTAGQTAKLSFDPATGVGMVVMTNQAMESVYTGDMQELIYGKYDGALYGVQNAGESGGVFSGARTIKNGPYSFYRLFSTLYTPGPDDESFGEWSEVDGETVLMMPMFDFIRIKTPVLIWEGVLLLSLFFGGTAGLLYLLAIGVLAIFRRSEEKKRQRKLEKPLRPWRTIAVLLYVLTFSAFLVLAISLMTFQSPQFFQVLFGVFLLLLNLIAVQFVSLIVMRKRLTDKPKEKRRTAFVAILLLLAAMNILYWQSYQFWRI